MVSRAHPHPRTHTCTRAQSTITQAIYITMTHKTYTLINKNTYKQIRVHARAGSSGRGGCELRAWRDRARRLRPECPCESPACSSSLLLSVEVQRCCIQGVWIERFTLSVEPGEGVLANAHIRCIHDRVPKHNLWLLGVPRATFEDVPRVQNYVSGDERM